MSSKYTDQELVMHSKSDNIEIMIYDKAGEIIQEPYESLLSRYQIGLETTMKISNFVFYCVNLLRCKCHKVNLKCVGSYMDSPDWIKNDKATINPIDDDDKCFQYAATVVSNHEEIGKNLKRISRIKCLIHKHNWKGINYPSGKDDWKDFEKNYTKIALNVFYV